MTLVHISKTGGSALRDVIDYTAGYCKNNYNYLDNHQPLYQNGQPPPPLAEGSLFQNAHHHEKTTLQKHMCALARITNSKSNSNNHNDGLIHLDRNLDKARSEDHFLVPIWNPVDRLVSWFYYEKHFQTIKQTRYSRALNEIICPSRCGFSTVNEVFLGKEQQEKRQQEKLDSMYHVQSVEENARC